MEEGAYYSTSLIHHTPNLIYYYNPGAFIVQKVYIECELIGRYQTSWQSKNQREISNYLFMTASKSWTSIATALKAIPKTYNQKFCTFMFLEGRFLIIACNIQNHMFHKSIFEISQREVFFFSVTSIKILSG